MNPAHPFLRSSLGLKIVMALTGFILFGFVIVHMIGNLQVYLGPEAMDAYGEFLRSLLHGTGLWIARAVLLVAVLLHIWSAWRLTLINRAARPVAYREVERRESTYASRTMRWSGVILLLLVVGWLAMREHGAPLDAPADPASDYPARPEWYFLSLFQMLKYFEGRLEVVGSILIPGLAGAYLALLPFWDKAPTTALGPRLKYLAPLAGMGLGVVLLTFLSMRADKHDVPFQKAREQASLRADHAIELAKKGVPPDGPLAMLRRDPETRGTALFQEHCASCHRLGDMGPAPEKTTAPSLDGWGTPEWAASMLENPDALDRFGHTSYKGDMLSVVKPPPDAKKNWKPMRALGHGDKKRGADGPHSPDRVDHAQSRGAAAGIHFSSTQVSCRGGHSMAEAQDADRHHPHQPRPGDQQGHARSHQQQADDEGQAVADALHQ